MMEKYRMEYLRYRPTVSPPSTNAIKIAIIILEEAQLIETRIMDDEA